MPPREYEEVARRANHECEYCLAPEEFFNSPFEVEHLVPRARGGRGHLENLVLACRNCNGSKHARLTVRDPDTRVDVPIFNPRRQEWSDHFVFQITDAGVEIAGRTAIGRATAQHLNMNSAKAVEARTLWFEFYST